MMIDPELPELPPPATHGLEPLWNEQQMKAYALAAIDKYLDDHDESWRGK
jgi:hypothetical protein